MAHNTTADRYPTIYLSWEDPGGGVEHWLQWSTGREAGEPSPAWGLWSVGQGGDSAVEGGEWIHLADAEATYYDPDGPSRNLIAPGVDDIPADVLAAAARALGVEQVRARRVENADDGFGGVYFAIEVANG